MSLRFLRPAALWLSWAWLPSPAPADIAVVEAPDTVPPNAHYVGNRPPLRPAPFVRLPIRSIRPEGWLREQLRLQAAGFHGHLAEISAFLKKGNNSWLSPDGQGERGWEEVPYWLKGFADTAYILGDEGQIDEAKTWIEGAIRSRQPDGFFGPRGQGAKATVESTKGKYDLWPNMVMLNVLQSYYDYTGDRRVIDLMTRYFRWELSVPEDDFLPPFWQQQRAADNLASVYWLYNRTGEPWLLQLAEKIHRHTADWTGGIASYHNVNLAQGFGGPATFWQQSGDPMHLRAAERNFQSVRREYGQVPGGLWGGDENSRPGFTDPRQAVESCGMVEFMLSAERLLTITGNPVWADRCEDVAFNSLPAALTADMKALRYLTAPNMAVSDRRSHSPGIQNGGPMFCMDPHDHRCCQHNVGHGWPYFAGHLWLATPGNGLAVAFYGESTVTARVGDEGTEVTIREATHYPFDEAVTFRIGAPKAVTFPLYLRIPGWCKGAKVSVKGELASTGKALAMTSFMGTGGYFRIEQTWKDGDTVRLALPMRIDLRKWAKNHDSVSVDRGPLTYSIKVGEETVRSGGTDEWPAWEIRPTTPWNYGLVLDEKAPASSFEVLRRDWPESNRPWTPETTPIELKARGKRIANWKLDRFGLVAPLADSPIRSDEPEETITLIPMGAARLRISAFPVIGAGADAREWPEPPEPLPYKASASHCWEHDTVAALHDQLMPQDSADQAIPRFTWWPRKGTSEWAQLEFGRPLRLTRSRVFWFDDTAGGGGCALPASWRLLYRDGDAWKPVPNPDEPPIARDRFNTLSFDPIETDALRLEVQLRPDRSAGILEWLVE